MTAFGYDGDLPETELTCVEYARLWQALNGAPRGLDQGRLRVHSSYTDEREMRTAWGFADQDFPAVAEWSRDGQPCRHWLFAAPRDVAEVSR